MIDNNFAKKMNLESLYQLTGTQKDIIKSCTESMMNKWGLKRMQNVENEIIILNNSFQDQQKPPSQSPVVIKKNDPVQPMSCMPLTIEEQPKSDTMSSKLFQPLCLNNQPNSVVALQVVDQKGIRRLLILGIPPYNDKKNPQPSFESILPPLNDDPICFLCQQYSNTSLSAQHFALQQCVKCDTGVTNVVDNCITPVKISTAPTSSSTDTHNIQVPYTHEDTRYLQKAWRYVPEATNKALQLETSANTTSNIQIVTKHPDYLSITPDISTTINHTQILSAQQNKISALTTTVQELQADLDSQQKEDMKTKKYKRSSPAPSHKTAIFLSSLGGIFFTVCSMVGIALVIEESIHLAQGIGDPTELSIQIFSLMLCALFAASFFHILWN